jgi:hypothetical protein
VFAAITALALTTQIVLLGTGDPGPLSRRAGPATAIVVDGRAYLVDFGPGVIRRAAAAHEKGIAALDPVNLTHAFVTQLQFDRTGGYNSSLIARVVTRTWYSHRHRLDASRRSRFTARPVYGP